MGLKASVDILYNALVNGPAVQLTRYPVNAAGSALTSSAKTTGAYKYRAAGATQVQVVAAAVNTTGMWVCGGGLDTPSIQTTNVWVLWIGRGTIPAAVRAAELQFYIVQVTAVGQYAYGPAFLPYPLFVRAGVGIALDLADATVAADNTASGHIIVATGLGA